MAFKMTFEGEKLSIIMEALRACAPQDDEVVNEIFYEYYHVVDGKVVSWNSFRKIINK